MRLSNRKITFKEETQFSELFMNLQELVITTQNIVASTSNDENLSMILMRTMSLFVLPLSITDNPIEVIQLIRYQEKWVQSKCNEMVKFTKNFNNTFFCTVITTHSK